MNRNILRTILLATILSLDAAMAKSDTSIKLCLKDGSTTIYKLEDDTKMKFDNAKLHLSSFSWDICIPIENILRVEYPDIKSGINDVVDEQISVIQQGNSIIINGLKNNVTVNIYSITGIKMHSAKSTVSPMIISTENWSQGIYILNFSGKSIKIVKK